MQKRYRRLLFTWVMLPALAIAGDAYDLPDFGDSAGSTISPEYERRLGQMFLKQLRQFTPLVNDPEIESYIQSLGSQLASHSDNTRQPFTFFIVDDPQINAFAGPGGIIGINSGIILNSENESEVAAVIAHEIAHVTQRHLARQFEEASRYALPTAAAMIGAIIVGIANPQAGVAALAGISGLNAQNQINFTRANEEEADRIGMQTLVRSGFDPNAMPSFFEKLQRLSRYQKNGSPEFLRTHPFTTSRIADSRARAAEFPVKHKHDTNNHAYEQVRYKLLVDSMKTPADATLAMYKQLETHQSDEHKKLPLRYGLAYAYIKNGDYTLARQQIKYLFEDKPDDSAYLLLAAQLETRQSNYNAALLIYAKAYELYPDYQAVIMNYSRALLDIKQAGKAKEILKNYGRFHAHDLRSYALLGQAEAMLGNDIETAILQSEYYYLAGDTQLAVDKLKFIKQQFKLNYYQEQRVSARMTEFERELELQKKLKL